MPRPERPDEIRTRLRDLDRLVREAGADPEGGFTPDDLKRINARMQEAREAARADAHG